MICARHSRNSRGETVLTVPMLPTGIKAGVSAAP